MGAQRVSTVLVTHSTLCRRNRLFLLLLLFVVFVFARWGDVDEAQWDCGSVDYSGRAPLFPAFIFVFFVELVVVLAYRVGKLEWAQWDECRVSTRVTALSPILRDGARNDGGEGPGGPFLLPPVVVCGGGASSSTSPKTETISSPTSTTSSSVGFSKEKATRTVRVSLQRDDGP